MTSETTEQQAYTDGGRNQSGAARAITAVETLRLDEFPNVLWVRVHTADGLAGLGETFGGARAVEAYLHESAAPLLLGEDAANIEPLRYRLRPYVGYQAAGAEVRGNSALDIALWDLWGKRTGEPLWQLLGGRARESIETYNTCAGYAYVRGTGGQRSANWGLDALAQGPYEDLEAFLQRADELAVSLLDDGISAMKIWPFDRYAERSHGNSITPGELREGLEPFRRIREAVGERMAIMLECHSLWSLPAAVEIARAVQPYDVYWIEDPIQMTGFDALASYKAQTGARVTASETLAGRARFADLMRSGAVDVVMLDIGWVGGMSEARAIAAMAEALQLPIAPHDCTGPVVYTASTHLSVHAPNALIQESVRAFYTGWYTELVDALPAVAGGRVSPPPRAGLGVELLAERFTREDAHVHWSGPH